MTPSMKLAMPREGALYVVHVKEAILLSKSPESTLSEPE